MPILLHDPILAWGAEHSGDPAVRVGDRTLSYGELLERSEQTARALAARELGPGSLVAVCLPPGVDLIVALLGVLRSGAAYLPLDPSDPPARRTTAASELGAAALIGHEDLGLPALTPATFAAETGAEPVRLTDPDALAYVITTSGTTGRPKGVMVPHRCAVALFDAMGDHVEAGPGDVWLSMTSPAFDISVFELFWTLGRGVLVDLADTSPAALFSTPLAREDHDITHFQATPTLLSGLLMDAATRRGIACLRHLTSTGEALPLTLARELRDLVPGRLLNAYGPTEATIWATVDRIDRPVEPPVTIGRPLRGQRVHVLDPSGAPVGDGEEGELAIGGSGVTLGYLGQPELTADRFVADPWSEDPAARLYRTGDLGHVLADGRVVCRGRTDRQIKLRGHRIELDEVEHALLALPDVDAGAVVVVGDEDSRRIVAAAVGPGHGADVRRRLAEVLPPPAVPSEVRLVADLPRSSSGKVDRRALSSTW